MKGPWLGDLYWDLTKTITAILQRVASASVTVDKQLVSSIGKGILVLAAIGPDDTKKDVESMASKVLKMKLWPDENGGNVSDISPFSDLDSTDLRPVEEQCPRC